MIREPKITKMPWGYLVVVEPGNGRIYRRDVRNWQDGPSGLMHEIAVAFSQISSSIAFDSSPAGIRAREREASFFKE